PTGAAHGLQRGCWLRASRDEMAAALVGALTDALEEARARGRAGCAGGAGAGAGLPAFANAGEQAGAWATVTRGRADDNRGRGTAGGARRRIAPAGVAVPGPQHQNAKAQNRDVFQQEEASSVRFRRVRAVGRPR